MDFEKLINELQASRIPLKRIMFKANWMKFWYVPLFIGVGTESLNCDSPGRGRPGSADFFWGWKDSNRGSIRSQQIEKIEFLPRRTILPSSCVLKVYLRGVRP